MSKTVQYSEMKDSRVKWIGQMPSSWTIRPLKYVFSIKKEIAGQTGLTVLSVTQKGIKPKNMSARGQFALDYSKYQLVKVGDFVMNHMDLLTGWVDISQYDGVTSPDYRVFINTSPNNFVSDYYKYLFQYCYTNRIFYGLGQGVAGFGRWRLPADMFLNFSLPVPPKNEQISIVDFLDKKSAQIDAVIAEARASIEACKEWRSAVIFECVTNGLNENTEKKDTGIEYIGKIPSHWTVRKTGDISEKLTDYVASGSFASLRENVQYLDNPDYARLIRTVDLSESTNRNPVYISKESYDFLSNSNLFGGELILSNIGSVGSVYQYKPMYAYASLAPNAIMLTMKGNNRFYYYWFSNPRVKESLRLLGGNAVQCKFNKTQLRQYMIPQPPLEEQNAMAEYLDEKCEEIDALIAEKESLIYELENYKKSLIFEAVTGKRKVV